MVDPIKVYPAKPSKVYFYGTCLVDMFYPDAGMAGMPWAGTVSPSLTRINVVELGSQAFAVSAAAWRPSKISSQSAS